MVQNEFREEADRSIGDSRIWAPGEGVSSLHDEVVTVIKLVPNLGGRDVYRGYFFKYTYPDDRGCLRVAFLPPSRTRSAATSFAV